METTSLHLDVLRDLKRIHSHICSVAYPVLEAAGEIAAADVGRERSDHARRTRRQARRAVAVRKFRPGFPRLSFTGAAPHNRNLCVKST